MSGKKLYHPVKNKWWREYQIHHLKREIEDAIAKRDVTRLRAVRVALEYYESQRQ